MKKIYNNIFLLAAVMLLAGCAKEMNVTGDGAALRFSTNSLEIVSTKAAGEALTGMATNRTMNLYSDGKLSDMTLEVEESVNTDGFAAATKDEEQTELTTFTVAGFDGTDTWFPEQEVNTYTSYFLYRWKSSKDYQFFGYANLPSSSDVASAAIASDGVTLTYTAVPENAAYQNDILLGASYSNDASKGEAKMTFFHPLAEVVFKLGSISGTSVKITGITLDGVYKSGTVVCDGDEQPIYNDELGCYAFTWDPTNTTGQVSQTIDSDIVSGDVIGVPFMLIPQEFTSSKPLTITVNAVVDGNAKIFATTLNSGSWLSGKKYTYTIKEKILELELEISSLQDLLAFKDEIESPTGKDYSGYTIKIKRDISLGESFEAIYDQHKRLNGATIDGECRYIMAEGDGIFFSNNSDDTNGTVGLFSTLKSNDVTFKNVTFRSMYSAGKGASFVAGTFKGNKITIENVCINYCHCYNKYSSVTTGAIIGFCQGDAAIKYCNIEDSTIECNGYYSSFVIGEAIGSVNVDIEGVTIRNCTIDSSSPSKAFGLYVGQCTGSNGMKISLENCACNSCTKNGSWPSNMDEYYSHTGAGTTDSGPTTDYHFHAVAWNKQAPTTLKVSMSEMYESNVLF